MKKSELLSLIREVIEEASKTKLDGGYLIKSFKDLPDTPPYGFIIFPDLSIGVVTSYQAHHELLMSVWENTDEAKQILDDAAKKIKDE